MKLTTGILAVAIIAMAGGAWAQNPDAIDNARSVAKSLQQKQANDTDAALNAAGVKSPSAKPAPGAPAPAVKPAPIPGSKPAPAAAPAKAAAKPATTPAPATKAATQPAPKPAVAKTAPAPAQAKTSAPAAKLQAAAGKPTVMTKAPAPKAAAPKLVAAKKPAAKKVAPAPKQAAKETKPAAPPLDSKPGDSAKSDAAKQPKPEDKKWAMSGKRDPFFSPVVQNAGGSGCSTGKKCLEIGQINLRGVVKSDNGFIAVVTNSLNKAYFLRENDPVFNGYVVRITGDSVVFQETVQDKLGKAFTREVVKRIFTPAV
jgi:hypothetical protein